MLWVRRSILVIWLLLIWTAGPALLHRINAALELPPGPQRDAILGPAVRQAIGQLLLFPLFLLAFLGYGVRPRHGPSVWSHGGP
jgi:hypothetical protein